MRVSKTFLELEKIIQDLENLQTSFDYVKISVASPTRIKSWAERYFPNGEIRGQVLIPETINFRTHEPETGGLFCQRIFGPIKNWRCKCGKYNGFIFDRICEFCDIEIVEARVRRYRTGYIALGYPVVHLWYLKGTPSYLCILLRYFASFKENKRETSISTPQKFSQKEMKFKYAKEEATVRVADIENLIYFKRSFRKPLPECLARFRKQPILDSLDSYPSSYHTLRCMIEPIRPPKRRRRAGAEVLKAALENINIRQEIKICRLLLNLEKIDQKKMTSTEQKIMVKKLRILQSFLVSKIKPAWLILTNISVLPPTLRPLVELENGRLVVADVNEIYRLLIIRNSRLLTFLFENMVPSMILDDGRKLVQETVDSLIENARLPKERQLLLNDKPLKSLTEVLEGKQGRFRQTLLGKRVDYSGRSVIIVGPTLRLNQCGLPYEMAKELFQPFLIHQLLETKIPAPSHNTRLATVIIKKNKPFVWNLLVLLTKKYSILLNRAPTLHRFGIQAFDPVLILGQAIHLHPLVCTGFNADFDGDQMAVHLPLYEVSQLEIRTMMRPSYNVLSPSNGDVILKPTQDMVIGCYYLTLMITKRKQSIQKWFPNEKDALTAFYQKKLNLHTPILVRYSLKNKNFLSTTNTVTASKEIPWQDFEALNFITHNEKLQFLDPRMYLFVNKEEIVIYKSFQLNQSSQNKEFSYLSTSEKKYYFFTSLGIIIAYEYEKENCLKEIEKYYHLTDLFLETSPGRLIFSLNFKNALKEQVYDY